MVEWGKAKSFLLGTLLGGLVGLLVAPRRRLGQRGGPQRSGPPRGFRGAPCEGAEDGFS